MKLTRQFMLLILISGIVLVSCSSGHLGGNEIAFIRDGHIWTIDPNGANAFQVVSQDSPVIGYSWSPDHQMLVFRTRDAQATKPAPSFTANEITGQIADAPGTINTVGVDGGTPIPIMLSSAGIQYSNPIWSNDGTRLVYRQESSTATFLSGNALWWVSQNDQPEGIAAKELPSSFSFPSLSYLDSMAIGNSNRGMFSSTLQGTHVQYLLPATLPGHPLPATLERVLWQPSHTQPLILYAVQSDSSSKIAPTQLMTLAHNGQLTMLTSCSCRQFAWSPNGTYVLYSTETSLVLLNVDTHTSFAITSSQGDVPYWSPDDKFLVLDGVHRLQMVNIATQAVQTLLSDATTISLQSSPGQEVSTNALVQPVPNNIWASDSQHFLFLTRSRLHWQGTLLSPGLYNVTVNSSGQPQGRPVFVDGGRDTQVGWSYLDPNISFLY